MMKMTQCRSLTLLSLFCLSLTPFAVSAVAPNATLVLKKESAPQPTDLYTKYAKDKTALVALGKALFWDMQAGSDGVQSCGSCHFHAGADNRAKNQLNPGANRANADTSFAGDSIFSKAPNYTLTTSDYPFHKLSDPLNRKSLVSSPPDITDVAASQGVALRHFTSNFVGCTETATYLQDTVFHVAGINTRRVEPRNTPTVINAVFNKRNFWDGRALDQFNGVNRRGATDASAHLYKVGTTLGSLVPTQVLIDNSSLASQAVSPMLSDVEMSAENRPFIKIGRRLVGCKPLAKQLVSPQDSVLGSLSLSPSPGINQANYGEMIKSAFLPQWWDSSSKIRIGLDGTETVITSNLIGPRIYSLMQYNFSLFFGLAVQAYEATLVSDETPWDKFNRGATVAPDGTVIPGGTLTADENAGADLFFSPRTRCANCHRGAALTDASVDQIKALGDVRIRAFETYYKNSSGVLTVRQRQLQLTDTGFNNIGVRPTLEDLGVGSKFDPGPAFTNDLSIARKCTTPGCGIDLVPFGSCFSGSVLAVDGAFKIPGLRNVELTAPYFHNGGTLSLSHVLDFYLRGSDFNPNDAWNADRTISTSIFPLVSLAGPHFDITASKGCDPLSTLSDKPITSTEKAQLLKFLNALTDNRVRLKQAPFDHPQLFVPNGHPGDTNSVTSDGKGYATDSMLEIKATGAGGTTVLPNFLGLP